MNKNFKDYFWKEGIPYGINAADESETSTMLTYKIVMDPYRKHISIESYQNGQFCSVIYDSALLDFRHLKQAAHPAWHKSIVHEDENGASCLIRNQDDRLLFQETYTFHQNLCRECKVASVHGIALSTQRMFYKAFGDHFNGVILFDINTRPVMLKQYEVDVETGEFTKLLNEEWNMDAKKQGLISRDLLLLLPAF
jgi:hypothetical protein